MSDLDEEESDTRDLADAYVLLDGFDVRLGICTGCGKAYCKCCTIHRTFPCVCDETPFTQRELRNTALASWDGPTRRRRG